MKFYSEPLSLGIDFTDSACSKNLLHARNLAASFNLKSFLRGNSSRFGYAFLAPTTHVYTSLILKIAWLLLLKLKSIKGVLRDLFNFFIRPFLESFAKPPDKGYHQNERIIRPRPVFTTSLERRYRCDNVKTHYHYINPCHHWNSIEPTGCEITTS